MTWSSPQRPVHRDRRSGRASVAALGVGAVLVPSLVACLVAAVAGGLFRAGLGVPAFLADVPGLGPAIAMHAALMLSGFFGTVISAERAIASRSTWAFGAPLASGIAGLLLLGGLTSMATWLSVAATSMFVVLSLVPLRRGATPRAVVSLLGGLAWWYASLLFALGRGGDAAILGWFLFPVLTIIAERLDASRPVSRPAGVACASLVALLLLAAVAESMAPNVGKLLFGASLVAMAAWLLVFDAARRTVFATGLARYSAVCLLAAYGWLAVSGIAWIGLASGFPDRDMALHALGLGFLMSMVMGQAPIALPASTRLGVMFGAWFYLPVALLQISLAVRVFGGLDDPALRLLGAELNAVALALFALTLASSAIAHRLATPV